MTERWKPSVTVAAIEPPASTAAGAQLEYLLVEEETTEGLRLNNPAGHLDPGESPQQAVVREALEETAAFRARAAGRHLPRALRAAGERRDVTYLRFAFAGSAARQTRRGRSMPASSRTLSMTLAELRASRPRHRSGLVLRCIEDAAAGCAVPLERIVTEASVYAPEIKRGSAP